MPRNPRGLKRRCLAKNAKDIGACPVSRSTLLGVVADVAGVGERNRAVVNLLLDSNSCALAKKRVQEAVRRASCSDTSPVTQSESQSPGGESQSAAPKTSPAIDTSNDEPALDVRVAGDCAQIHGEQQFPLASGVNATHTAQLNSGEPTDTFNHADSLLRLDSANSHEVILRTCLSISTVDITFQVPVEEGRQSAVQHHRADALIPQVVVTELQRAVVRDCLWLRGCRFRAAVPGVGAVHLCEQWISQRREKVIAVRTALLMGYHSRLGGRSVLGRLPPEVMMLLLDKSAPMKFELCLQL